MPCLMEMFASCPIHEKRAVINGTLYLWSCLIPFQLLTVRLSHATMEDPASMTAVIELTIVHVHLATPALPAL